MNHEPPRDPGDVELVADSRRGLGSLSRRRVATVALVAAGVLLAALASDHGPEDAADAVRTGEEAARPVDSTIPVRGATATQVADTTAAGLPSSPGAMSPGPEPAPAPPPPPPPPQPLITPAVVARPVPSPGPAAPGPAGPTKWTSRSTAGGYVATDVGCASGTSAGALDGFFRARMGPVIGHDYQHVYALGDGRLLWLFQDTFLDHAGNAGRLDQASFAHNTAMVQDGSCFTLLHRGTVAAPASFEPGTGERTLSTWFWPLGGEAVDGRLRVFWAEMAKTADPHPPDGLGWVPVRTWLATYDTATLTRLAFEPAPNDRVGPIYGFAVSSDAEHSYLFGNTFDQNLARQGGYHACPCSATAMWLARVPRGRLEAPPEYRTATGWSADPGRAVPFLTRFHAENPMQPRYLNGHWVAVTKVDGYWAEELVVDVAEQPWGPWTTTSRWPVTPRGGDPLMNTYHAHLMPWLSDGSLVVSISQNARNMLRDAWPHPERYRLQFLSTALVAPPGPPPTTAPTTTSTTTTTATTTTAATTTSTSTSTTISTTSSSVTTTDPATTSPPSTEAPPCSATSSSIQPTSTTSPADPSTTTTTTCRAP